MPQTNSSFSKNTNLVYLHTPSPAFRHPYYLLSQHQRTETAEMASARTRRSRRERKCKSCQERDIHRLLQKSTRHYSQYKQIHPHPSPSLHVFHARNEVVVLMQTTSSSYDRFDISIRFWSFSSPRSYQVDWPSITTRWPLTLQTLLHQL